MELSMLALPEPKDKLDAMTTPTVSAAQAATSGVGVVNGPEDDLTDGPSIDWRVVVDDVRRLRQRIFTASQAGDLKRVRNLQKLMLRSHANTLASVRPGDGGKCWPRDGGHRRQGRGGAPGQGRVGRLGAAPVTAVGAPAGQAGVHPQGERQTASARYPGDRRPGAPSAGGQRVGARVGSAVRTAVLRLPAGPRCRCVVSGDA
ncbi:MAG: reverse transcriptase N-terminal domain-containing protein [Pseudonocardia sp.]|nr:reverse transcriptase N-terminal domain-containing protein [Pseudonocardia sp.]